MTNKSVSSILSYTLIFNYMQSEYSRRIYDGSVDICRAKNGWCTYRHFRLGADRFVLKVFIARNFIGLLGFMYVKFQFILNKFSFKYINQIDALFDRWICRLTSRGSSKAGKYYTAFYAN